MKRFKQWLSSAMALTMAVTMIPTMALAAEEPDQAKEPVTVTLEPDAPGNIRVNVTINEMVDAATLDIPAIAHSALDQWQKDWQGWEDASFDPGMVTFFHLNVTNHSDYTYGYLPGSGETTPDLFNFADKDTVVYRTLNPALHKLLSETKFEEGDFTSSEIMASYYPEMKRGAELWYGVGESEAETMENINAFFLHCSSDSRQERITDENGEFVQWGPKTYKVDIYLSDESIAAHLYQYYDLSKDEATRELTTEQIIQEYLDRYYCEFYQVSSLEELTIDQLKSLFSGVEEGVGIEEIAPDTYGPSDHAFFLYQPETNSAVAKAGWTYMYRFMMTFGLWEDHSDQYDPHHPDQVMGYLMKTPAILGNATTDEFPDNPAYLDEALGGEESPLASLTPGESASVTLAVTKNGPFDRNCYRDRIHDFSFGFQMTRQEAPEPPAPPVPQIPQWEISKSKTATNLDEDYRAQVTLSLPSAQEQLVSDVVFVLDKSTSADLETQALEMLSRLKAQIADTGAKVKVGVVIFNKEAHATGWLDLATEYEAIEAAITQKISSGTNTHAGLLAGKAMLDGDTAVAAQRKHLIFVSDGITYLFGEEPTAVAWNGIVDNEHLGDDAIWANWTSPDCWKLMYGEQTYIPGNWDTWMAQTGAKLTAQGDTYDYAYGSTPVTETPKKADQYKDYAMSIDKALYLTNRVYEACQEAGYHCWAMTADTGAAAANPWGPAFMEYLSDGADVNFDEIQNEIYYMLDAGSYVNDVMGSGKDDKGNAYQMNFVGDPALLTLTVGGKVLPVTEVEAGRVYGFGDAHGSKDGTTYPFLLKVGAVADCQDSNFQWMINVPVSNFAPVQLTYTVELKNPQTKTGTYGQYDADGSHGYGALLTNLEAVLIPVDSNGTVYPAEPFAKPTVSYEVEKSGGGSSGGGGGSPVLNTKEHFSYIIGYKDGYIRPNGYVTRGEVATIFFRMLTDEARDQYWSQTNAYSDCSSELWCNNAISTLSNMGVIDGYQDGTFRPNGHITRAEFAKMAVGFFETTAKAYEGAFADVTQDAWYASYVEAASRVGLIRGYEDGTFRPDHLISRAETCVIMNRALDRHPDEEYLLPTREMINWPDNHPDDWYYADIMEATNSHDYHMRNRVENGEKVSYETWTEKLPQRDWAAFEHAWSTAHSAPGGEVVKD